jgi:hypothetical protein
MQASAVIKGRKNRFIIACAVYLEWRARAIELPELRTA